MPPITILIKPVSGSCNMRCQYCFYVDEMNKRSVHNLGYMTEETLYGMLQNVFEYATHQCSIMFQGGEPTLAGLTYYRNVVKFVDELNVNECDVHYSLQTNGYDLNEEWMKFFHKHNFLIGISLDGTQEIHDQYRIDANGDGTYDRVMKSIELLKKYNVSFNVLTVIHGNTVGAANRIYNHFKRNELTYQQFIECLDPIDTIPGNEIYSLTPEKYGEFLVAYFKKWYKDMSTGQYVYNRYFENLIGILLEKPPESCAMAGCCGTYLCIEADGSAYPCDFYVLDQWKLGNIQSNSIEELNQVRQELKFVETSRNIPDECKACKWYALCRNGCRRNCEPTNDTTRSQNYFCKSYKMFFEYAYPYLENLARNYRNSN